MAIIAILVIGTVLYNVKLQSITKYNAQQQSIVDGYNLSSEKQSGNVTIDSGINGDGNGSGGTNKDSVILQSDTSIIESTENSSTNIGNNENIGNDNALVNGTLSGNPDNNAVVNETKASSIVGGENNATTSEITEVTITCNIEIRCDTIFENMNKWTNNNKEKASIVTTNVIMKKMDIRVTNNSTVLDVLKKATIMRSISLEANLGYIKSINQLEQLDAGRGSGWLYWVNNVSPSVTCALYTVKNGDTIKWQYTCDYGNEFKVNGDLQ